MNLRIETDTVRFGIWLPFSHAQWVTNMARLAEQSGWDGVFLREYVVGLDRWIPIAAAALSTQKILIGGVISPSSSANPHSILHEAYRIQKRSGGRLVVCLGKSYQEKMDHPVAPNSDPMPSGLMRERGDGDQTVSWLTQQLVVWQLGLWPDRESILQALKYQGIIPVIRDGSDSLRAPSVEEVADLVEFIRQVDQPRQQFEIVVEIALSDSRPKKPSTQVELWDEAGANWLIINYGLAIDGAQGIQRLQNIIGRGPPS
jgi:hypothetical protein